MKSVSFHMQQSNSPNSRNCFSIIVQLVSHLLTDEPTNALYPLQTPIFPNKNITHYLLPQPAPINILFQNAQFFSSISFSLRSISAGISARISISLCVTHTANVDGMRITLARLRSRPVPAIFPPRLLLSIRSAQRFQRLHARARYSGAGCSRRNRKARRAIEISYVTLNDSEHHLAKSRGGFCSSDR